MHSEAESKEFFERIKAALVGKTISGVHQGLKSPKFSDINPECYNVFSNPQFQDEEPFSTFNHNTDGLIWKGLTERGEYEPAIWIYKHDGFLKIHERNTFTITDATFVKMDSAKKHPAKIHWRAVMNN